MSDGLTLPPHYYDTPTDGSSRTRVVVRVGALLVLFAVAGLAGGFAWRHLWTPPEGFARGGGWVPAPVEEGLQNDFSGVAWYVVVALTLGVLLGTVTALVLDRAEIVGVGVAILGSALVAYLVLTVGERLSPPDPDEVAARSADDTRIRGDLEVEGSTPLLSAPVGALTAVSTVYLLTTRRRVTGGHHAGVT